MNPILKRVREVIADSGLSQTALERAELGTQGMFSKWARVDDAEPSSGHLARLVTFFGVNGHWLLTGEGDKCTLAPGADAVYQKGVAAGLARAEKAVRALRVTPNADDRRGAAEHVTQFHAEKKSSRPPRRNRKQSNGG